MEIKLNPTTKTTNHQLLLRIIKGKKMTETMEATETVFKATDETIDGMIKTLDETMAEMMDGMMSETIEEIVKSIKAEAQWDGPIGWIAS